MSAEDSWMQRSGILRSKDCVCACIFHALNLDIIYYQLSASSCLKMMSPNKCIGTDFKWKDWEMDPGSIKI